MKNDAQIQKEVLDELRWNPLVSSTQIGVAVKNGVVTLSGTVDSFAKKTAAEQAASRIGGVRAVAEDLEVRPLISLKKNDSEIAEAVVNALRWNSSVNDEKVKVKVEDGWVTLQGESEWQFQKESAKRSIEDLSGVKGISNLIHVTPRASMTDVKDRIKSAFYRHANIDARDIQVQTSGSQVTLTGKVRSLAEKRDAENAAWAAPGVTKVDNQLEVRFEEAVAQY